MEAVPVIILERRPGIRNGGIEVGMDRTKILVVDDESRMRKLVKDFPNADGAAIAELNEYFGIQAE